MDGLDLNDLGIETFDTDVRQGDLSEGHGLTEIGASCGCADTPQTGSCKA